jgi:hypothetical protein
MITTTAASQRIPYVASFPTWQPTTLPHPRTASRNPNFPIGGILFPFSHPRNSPHPATSLERPFPFNSVLRLTRITVACTIQILSKPYATPPPEKLSCISLAPLFVPFILVCARYQRNICPRTWRIYGLGCVDLDTNMNHSRLLPRGVFTSTLHPGIRILESKHFFAFILC